MQHEIKPTRAEAAQLARLHFVNYEFLQSKTKRYAPRHIIFANRACAMRAYKALLQNEKARAVQRPAPCFWFQGAQAPLFIFERPNESPNLRGAMIEMLICAKMSSPALEGQAISKIEAIADFNAPSAQATMIEAIDFWADSKLDFAYNFLIRGNFEVVKYRGLWDEVRGILW